jgi:H+/gluconate symporter-like permease
MILAAVPGALKQAGFWIYLSLAQGSPSVGTTIAHRVNAPPRIEQGDGFGAPIHPFAATLGYLRSSRDIGEPVVLYQT